MCDVWDASETMKLRKAEDEELVGDIAVGWTVHHPHSQVEALSPAPPCDYRLEIGFLGGD